MSASLAPSWVETTLRWLEAECPAYATRARGITTPAGRLANSLVKMSYRLAEHAGDRKAERAEIDRLVGLWDFDSHSQLRRWLSAGGYKAPAAAPAPAPAWPSVSAVVPPAVIYTPDGPEMIELVMPDDEEPAARPAPLFAPVQTLEDVLADADERYGAW